MRLLDGRTCHDALHPLHSAIYFAAELEEELTAAGLRPGRMCYFASRSAALGAVGAGTVTATFYNFSPELIARHIPRAWQLATPTAILQARWVAVDRMLRRLLGDEVVGSAEVAEAARLAGDAATACQPEHRPLYAAHAELTTPTEPHLALWHAITLLREHRGDGHLTALAGAELDGVEALVTHTATGHGMTPEFARTSRGWSEQQWQDGEARLADRGLLSDTGALTDAGSDLRRAIEDDTDRLASASYRQLGDAGCARLTELGRTLSGQALRNGAFPSGVFATRKKR